MKNVHPKRCNKLMGTPSVPIMCLTFYFSLSFKDHPVSLHGNMSLSFTPFAYTHKKTKKKIQALIKHILPMKQTIKHGERVIAK